MSEIQPIRNPAEIAQPYAEELFMQGSFDDFSDTEVEETVLNELTQIVFDAKMLFGRFYVQAAKSIITPATQRRLDDVTVTHFDKLDYAGKFVGFSTVRIGRLMGRNSIRALCLTFEEPTLMPYMDQVPPEQWLHTPVHAVTSIEQLAS